MIAQISNKRETQRNKTSGSTYTPALSFGAIKREKLVSRDELSSALLLLPEFAQPCDQLVPLLISQLALSITRQSARNLLRVTIDIVNQPTQIPPPNPQTCTFDKARNHHEDTKSTPHYQLQHLIPPQFANH